MGFVWCLLFCCQNENVIPQEIEEAHHEWSRMKEDYDAATAFFREQRYQESINVLEPLHQQHPESKAILELLLLAELNDPESFQRGYQRIQSYMRRHPGDSDFRLLQTKFFLQAGEIQQANDSLAVLLFNRSFHPWVLAQDSVLRRYKDELSPAGLSFELVQAVGFDIPEKVLVGDVMDVRIDILHLKDCEPTVLPFEIQSKFRIERLALYHEDIDDVVQKTSMVLTLKALLASISGPIDMEVECESHKARLHFSGITIIDVGNADQRTELTTLTIPRWSDLEKMTGTTPWVLYVNNVPIRTGFWKGAETTPQ